MHKDGIRGRVSRCGERGGGGLGLHIDQYERDNLNTLAMECIGGVMPVPVSTRERIVYMLRPHTHILLLLQVQHVPVRERALRLTEQQTASSVTYPV